VEHIGIATRDRREPFLLDEEAAETRPVIKQNLWPKETGKHGIFSKPVILKLNGENQPEGVP
jgi:hypothetical protein